MPPTTRRCSAPAPRTRATATVSRPRSNWQEEPRRLMRIRLSVFALTGVLVMASSSPGFAQTASDPVFEDFSQDVIGASPSRWSTPVGFWSVGTVDGTKPLLFEDGRQFASGGASLLADQAKALYGDRWAE